MAPCFRKGDKEEKENYRPISILSDFSKVFERLINNQKNKFKEKRFSEFFTGFRKKTPQYALLTMIEN